MKAQTGQMVVVAALILFVLMSAIQVLSMLAPQIIQKEKPKSGYFKQEANAKSTTKHHENGHLL